MTTQSFVLDRQICETSSGRQSFVLGAQICETTHGAASPATAYTLTGPATGVNGVADTFTLTPNGDATGIHVTLSDGGAGGTFSPSTTITFTSAAAQTFTYSRPSSGTSTLTPTNDGGLTDPSPLSYTTGTSGTIAVNDANLFFSPYNWKVSGGTNAITNTPGAYLKCKFHGTSCALLVDVSVLVGASAGSGTYPTIKWSIDEGTWQTHQLTSGDTSITLGTSLSNANHTLIVYLSAASYAIDRWTTPVSALIVTGLQLTTGETLVSQTLFSGRMIVYGDSNLEGYGAGDATLTFGHEIARAFKCEVGIVGFAFQGYLATASGNIPDLHDAWNLYWSGASRLSAGLFSPAPDYILSMHGENDGSDVTATVQGLIASWRTAAPSAVIGITVPANRNQASHLSSAVSAAGDSRAFYIDTNDNFLLGAWGDGTHMSAFGDAHYAAAIIGEVFRQSATGGGGLLSGGGFTGGMHRS